MPGRMPAAAYASSSSRVSRSRRVCALRDIEAGQAAGRFSVPDAGFALSAVAGGLFGLLRVCQRHPERVTETAASLDGPRHVSDSCDAIRGHRAPVKFPVERDRGVDQGQVSERLREVAELFAGGSDLF